MVLVDSALGNALASLLGGDAGAMSLVAWLFYLLILFIFVDIISGWLKGFYTGKLDSAKNYKGYIRKGVIILMAIIGISIDFGVSMTLIYLGLSDMTFFGLQVVSTPIVSGLLLVWFSLGELLSITENMHAMGVKLPKFMCKGLNRLHKSIDDGDINIKTKVEVNGEEVTVVTNKENDKHG